MNKNVMYVIIIHVFSNNINGSWFDDVKNFFYNQKTAEGSAKGNQKNVNLSENVQVQPSAEQAISKLPPSELMQLELRHLDSLGLRDKKNLLELEIRHSQSKNLDYEVDKLEKEIQEKNEKLESLKNQLKRQRILQNELKKVLEDLTKSETLRDELSRMN